MSVLGIDVGTSGTKVLLLSADGDVIGAAESPHQLLSPKPGWTEQDPEEWWTAAIKATRTLLRRTKTNGTDIQAIGLSGQMHGSVFLNAAGKVLRPALLWNDQRTAQECVEIEVAAGGRKSLIAKVSNPALTGFTAPKILWFRKHEPRLFEKCTQILLPKDYVRYRLTGEFASDVSDASGTLLLDVKKRKWHSGMMSSLQLDPSLFPRLVESQEITGKLTAEAARQLGVSAGIPVVGGAGDQAAGAVGSGVVAPGIVSATMGTSGVLFATSAGPQTDSLGRVHTMCHAIPNTWCVFGCMLSAGGSFQYARSILFGGEAAKARDPGDVYPQMIAEAEAAPAGAENLFFLPYLTGERCPHPDPHARGSFIGLTPRHTRGHLLRAVLEGVTFGMREQAAIFREIGISIRQVRATGGGARSPFWRQLQADMYESPVVTINASEGAALGAAILASVGSGHYASVPQATAAIIDIRDRATPRKRQSSFYTQHYKKYAQLYLALKPFYDQLSLA